jgi:hypothetical protein
MRPPYSGRMRIHIKENNLRRIIGVVLVLGLIAIVLVAANALITRGSTHKTPTGTPTPLPTRASPGSNNRDVGISSAQSALDAAASAVDKLSKSLVASHSERWTTIKQVVYPGLRKREFRQLNRNAEGNPHAKGSKKQPLWQYWGYENRFHAVVESNISTKTGYYHVDSFRPGRTKLALYIVTHWETADGGVFDFPEISIVKMRWHKGKWLFVKKDKPAANRTPGVKLSDNLSYYEMKLLYVPFLEPNGFQKYDSKN